MDPTSQTPLEQKELIQFESNLAACYETEYLLSLKMQEEMCQRKDFYNDASEVAWSGSVAVDVSHNVQQQEEASMDCSVAVAGCDNMMNSHNLCPVNHSVLPSEPISTAAGLVVEEEQSLLCKDADFVMDTEELTTHHDGPRRKRLRAEF